MKINKILCLLFYTCCFNTFAQLPVPNITCKQVQIAYPEGWTVSNVDFTANAFWYQYNFTFRFKQEKVQVYCVNNKNFFSVDFLSQLFRKDIEKQYGIPDTAFILLDSSLYRQSYKTDRQNIIVSIFQRNNFVFIFIKDISNKKNAGFWKNEEQIVNILQDENNDEEYDNQQDITEEINKKLLCVKENASDTFLCQKEDTPVTASDFLENKMGVGKTGLFHHVSYSYPIDWVQMPNTSGNGDEFILASPRKQYIIVHQYPAENASDTVYNILTEEKIINNLPNIIFEDQIHNIRVANGNLFQYKRFYITEQSLYGLLAFVKINNRLYSVTIQSFSEISLENTDYNMFFNSFAENKSKNANGSTTVNNIRLKLPDKYRISKYKKACDTCDYQYFEASSNAAGAANIKFTVYDNDFNLIELSTKHQQEQIKMFTDSDKIALNRLSDMTLVYYTSSNEKALYCVSCCFHYKGKTFLIDIFTNALKDSFFEGNDFIQLIESIDIIE
ncbi:MAG: hypothetical protein J5701_00325 [Bacteroidales bacterium]|nr:hypothetical protein [Bacteroidales bacterium]